jgi:hypothetical protein
MMSGPGQKTRQGGGLMDSLAQSPLATALLNSIRESSQVPLRQQQDIGTSTGAHIILDTPNTGALSQAMTGGLAGGLMAALGDRAKNNRQDELLQKEQDLRSQERMQNRDWHLQDQNTLFGREDTVYGRTRQDRLDDVNQARNWQLDDDFRKHGWDLEAVKQAQGFHMMSAEQQNKWMNEMQDKLRMQKLNDTAMGMGIDPGESPMSKLIAGAAKPKYDLTLSGMRSEIDYRNIMGRSALAKAMGAGSAKDTGFKVLYDSLKGVKANSPEWNEAMKQVPESAKLPFLQYWSEQNLNDKTAKDAADKEQAAIKSITNPSKVTTMFSDIYAPSEGGGFNVRPGMEPADNRLKGLSVFARTYANPQVSPQQKAQAIQSLVQSKINDTELQNLTFLIKGKVSPEAMDSLRKDIEAQRAIKYERASEWTRATSPEIFGK